MPFNSLGNLVMLLGLRRRKTEAKIKSVCHFVFTLVQRGRWERDDPSFSITLDMSLVYSQSHFRYMPLTANHLLLHYKQTISSLQHNFIFPHEENRLFLGFSMKTTRIRFIFGSNSSTEKILGSSVHGCRWLLLLQFFYWLPGNAIYDNTSNPVHAY